MNKNFPSFWVFVILAIGCSDQMQTAQNIGVQAEAPSEKAPTSYHRPVFSPDGEKIIYMKQDESTNGDWELFLSDADGADPQRLTSHKGWDGYASFSPDGQTIAFARNDIEDPKYVVIMDLQSGATTQFSGQDGWLSITGWRNDRELLGFYETTDQRDIVYVTADGRILENVTNTPDISESDAFFSNDERILYFSASRPDGYSALEQIDLETGVRRVLVESNGGRIYGGAISPDGTTISFNDDTPGGDDSDAEIYFYDIASGATTQITDNEDWDHQLVWSPNKPFALFTSYRSGHER
ncbi:MAG: hypothetical protein AAFW68_00800, partial [Pseudomonadota bacterium]